jgi:ATP-binding cassette, subfamily G (WHITE), member 2, PDR
VYVRSRVHSLSLSPLDRAHSLEHLSIMMEPMRETTPGGGGDAISIPSSAATRTVEYFEPTSATTPNNAGESPGTLRQDSVATMDEKDQRELERIASEMNYNPSTVAKLPKGRGNRSSYVMPSDPTLDPKSTSFDLRRYLEQVVGLLRSEGITPATSGIAFKDLTVTGTGKGLHVQRTVSDWLSAPAHLGEYISFAKNKRTILHSIDGIVNSGEMLIVLGRPGSGCSTLLKTMTGQMSGLTVDKRSDVSYNGISQDQMMKEFKGEAIYNQEVSIRPPISSPFLITIPHHFLLCGGY